MTTNIATTLPFQNRSNIARLVLSPDKRTLISIDVDGFALFINMVKKVVLAHFNFRDTVTAIEFSPDNKFFFVACDTKCKIFESPSMDHKTFSPLVLYKKYGNLHSQTITGVTWSPDSRFILTWAKDLTLKMISLHKIPQFLPFTFSGNKKPIVSAFFSADGKRIFSIAQNGTLLLWKWIPERSDEADKMIKFAEFKMGKRLKLSSSTEKPNAYNVTDEDLELMTELEREASRGRYLLEKRSRFQLGEMSKIVSCCVSASSNTSKIILVIGQSNGVFSLYDLDTLESIHSFQISQNRIDSIAVNAQADWVAMGSKEQGQLFVWEWQSETYILKQ